ncbi:MAG: hypothetical protein HKN87_20820 [Saprospiraceae bacterium]|nr:hypothetical protein [Saprospiraceae bacterium]
MKTICNVLIVIQLSTSLGFSAGLPSLDSAQFLLFDVVFTYTKQDAENSSPSKSHFYVTKDLLHEAVPEDWTHPIDYRNGHVHIRIEVIEKPAGDVSTTWTVCYIPNKRQGNGYGCTGTALYETEGVYERDVSMHDFWENESILWSEGIKQMDLVIKDDSAGKGHAHKRQDAERFFPTRVRITLVQVAAGQAYDANIIPKIPLHSIN